MITRQNDGRFPVVFSSMPNFRKLPSTCDFQASDTADRGPESDMTAASLQLYRSSRPDFLTEDEVTQFLKFGIRCIIDFRSVKEYRKANGSKLLDNTYPVYKVRMPSVYKPGDSVKYIPLKGCGDHSTSIRKHYLINFFRLNYIWAVFRRAPWHIALYSLLWLIVDLVLHTGYTYFVRVFAKHVLNKEGLYGQYIDMITYSQESICAALKLLCDPKNIPAMINCAHGKDRTGIVSALALSCVGLSKEVIAEDYADSQRGLEQVSHRVHQEIVTRFHMCTSFTTARSETMMKVLEYIDDKYGSAADYLVSIGFSLDEQLQLKSNLLSRTN